VGYVTTLCFHCRPCGSQDSSKGGAKQYCTGEFTESTKHAEDNKTFRKRKYSEGNIAIHEERQVMGSNTG